MKKDPEDQALVDALVARVEGLSDREVEADGLGLSHERIRQLRAGEWSRLNAETRRKIRDYVEGAPAAVKLTRADEMRIAARWMDGMADVLRAAATESGESEARIADVIRHALGPKTNKQNRGGS